MDEVVQRKTVVLTTQQTIRAHYRSRISSNLGKMYLKDIKTYHVQKMMNDLLDIGLNISTVSNFKIVLKDMLRRAVQNEYIMKNPCDGVELPQIKTVESRVLTYEEQNQFFDFASSCAHVNVFAFAMLTGMRIGEIIGLQWSDIDVENKKISITKTLHYGDSRSDKRYTFFYTPTKTAASNRQLPMNDEMIALLIKHKEDMRKACFKNKGLWKPKEGFEDLFLLEPRDNL